MNIHGIITGDIVGSTKLDSDGRDRILDVLYETIDEINFLLSDNQKIKFEVFRGDSFQVMIPQAKDTLRIAILIRLKLIASRTKNISSVKNSTWDARLSIGLGTINYIKDSLNISDGEAFHNSGRAFDSLKKSYRLIIRTPWEDIDQEFEVECFMADVIIKRLTDKQAAISYQYLLEETTQKSLAEKIGVTPQAVNKPLQFGGNPLQEFIKRFVTLIEKQTQYGD